MSGFQVAIDGPVGVGKSSVSKALSERTGFIYIDTGAMYRALALHAIRSGVDLNAEIAVAGLIPDMDLKLTKNSVFLGGNDVTEAIRTREATIGSSAVAMHGLVRANLVKMQQNMAQDNDVIMDGRDIGFRVLPNAQVKVYLDAKPDTRAKRRFLELKEKGLEPDYNTVLSELEQRDYNDKNRKEDPLRAAGDALILDTSSLGFNEVVSYIMNLIKRSDHCPRSFIL